MTPEEARNAKLDERDAKLMDGLLDAYREVAVSVARMDERLNSQEREISATNARQREAAERIEKAVLDTGVACKIRLDQFEDQLEKDREKDEAKVVRNEVTLSQKLFLGAAIASPFAGAALTVLLR